MNKTVINKKIYIVLIFMAVLQAILPVAANAVIDGIGGPTFNLTAKAGRIMTGDGDSVYMWGYANGSGSMQFPGPTLIVNQGDLVTVNLSNRLSMPVSIVFPGQSSTAVGGTQGLITKEAPALTGGVPGTVTYTFTASNPGTYMYQSGTSPELQIEMGLVGALIVRPGVANRAYNDPSTSFDREYLFLLSEMDPVIHQLVENGNMALVDNTTRFPVLWFINGRNLPDTMSPAFAPILPNQPYDSMPMAHPGEKVLMRIIGGGRDLHPFHTHGNNHTVIARDGRLLKSALSSSPDLAISDFTTTSVPGETVDAIWTWTGEKLGWDIYGHNGAEPGICTSPDPNGFDPVTREYCPDHGQPFPVALPHQQDLTDGMFWSGSPFLGTSGPLPPGEGGFNPYAGLFFMWHSHAEKELTNNNIFVGGMATMAVILPPGVPIP
ncbi:MAG: multicopper oxidase domain-containing protein [Nitrospirae bacterium]|nr:multicopper oxidase domain-containing protein [Nitrospirota bacterium]